MASFSVKPKKKRRLAKKETRSIYNEIARNEKLKWQQDFIYMMLMNPDTTELDKQLKEWREEMLKAYPNLSQIGRAHV